MANGLKHANTFQDLIVYQKAKYVSLKVFELTKHFPTEERFSPNDQIRRSSRSVGAQIAEAWAKRRYEKHFVSKIKPMRTENCKKHNIGWK